MSGTKRNWHLARARERMYAHGYTGARPSIGTPNSWERSGVLEYPDQADVSQSHTSSRTPRQEAAYLRRKANDALVYHGGDRKAGRLRAIRLVAAARELEANRPVKKKRQPPRTA